MKASVYCTTKTVEQAEHIIGELKAAGFISNDISALLPDKRGTEDFAHEHNTKAPEGATTGGIAGLGVGATLGWLAGIGALAIPGGRRHIYRGRPDHGRPRRRSLGDAAVGTAAGGVVGALVGMGILEFEAKRYDAKIREGNILISVHTGDRKQRDLARGVFKRNQAEDISIGSEASP